MTVTADTTTPQRKRDRSLGLYRLLDPAVLANPYPLYDRLRTEDAGLLGRRAARLGGDALRRTW